MDADWQLTWDYYCWRNERGFYPTSEQAEELQRLNRIAREVCGGTLAGEVLE